MRLKNSKKVSKKNSKKSLKRSSKKSTKKVSKKQQKGGKRSSKKSTKKVSKKQQKGRKRKVSKKSLKRKKTSKKSLKQIGGFGKGGVGGDKDGDVIPLTRTNKELEAKFCGIDNRDYLNNYTRIQAENALNVVGPKNILFRHSIKVDGEGNPVVDGDGNYISTPSPENKAAHDDLKIFQENHGLKPSYITASFKDENGKIKHIIIDFWIANSTSLTPEDKLEYFKNPNLNTRIKYILKLPQFSQYGVIPSKNIKDPAPGGPKEVQAYGRFN
jgi:hypothetical protein